MKYTVNDDCIGCGMCNGICPNVFTMSDDGVAVAADTNVAPADMASAEEAMNSCPAEAISQA